MNNYVLLKRLALAILLLLATSMIAAPKKKNSPLTPVIISLLESSGAVAPEFRYALEVRLERTYTSYFIFRKEVKDGKQIINRKKRISESKFKNAYAKLRALGADKFLRTALPDEKLLGVSYNEFLFKSGSAESHFYYLNKELEKKNFKTKKDIIQIMKRLHP